jgi:hypothetical protein
METLQHYGYLSSGMPFPPGPPNPRFHLVAFICVSLILTVLFVLATTAPHALADSIHLPGDEVSDKLEAAGTLLKLIDTGIFKWAARVFAGRLALKEQRYGVSAICVAGAVIIGTTPKWVKNIFDVGDNQSLFSNANSTLLMAPSATAESSLKGYSYA